MWKIDVSVGTRQRKNGKSRWKEADMPVVLSLRIKLVRGWLLKPVSPLLLSPSRARLFKSFVIATGQDELPPRFCRHVATWTLSMFSFRRMSPLRASSLGWFPWFLGGFSHLKFVSRNFQVARGFPRVGIVLGGWPLVKCRPLTNFSLWHQWFFFRRNFLQVSSFSPFYRLYVFVKNDKFLVHIFYYR